MPHVCFSGVSPRTFEPQHVMTEVQGARLLADPVPAAHRFSDARRPAAEGAGILARWQRDRISTSACARHRPGAPEIRAARRPALRQRQYPYRPCAEQDPEGPGDALAADARLRFQLCAGLGLPRPADRMEDRGAISRQGPQQGRCAGHRVPPGMPRLRRALADVQREEFKRLGVTGDWDHPYSTMAFTPRRRSRARS